MTRFLPLLAFSACVLGVFSATAATPRLEWAYETSGKVYSSPILADLDGDGTTEVIACASRDRRILCLDGRGEVLWDFRMEDDGNDGIQAPPSVVDFDGDGKMEVFFITTGGVLGCLDNTGRLVWRTFTGDRVDYSGPVLADVTGDGRIEIVFGSDSGTLYCYGDAGVPLWRWQGAGQIRGIPAVACHAPSGTMRVYATFGGGASACFNSEGEVVWTHHEPATRNERRSGPALGDVDGDGELEVILATEDFQVIVRDAFTGEEEWRWKGKHKIDQTHSFALADFDDSGRPDIICGDGTGLGGPGHVYRLRDGKPLWTADVGGGVVQGPSIGDVDGDGRLEILVCSRSKRLVCLSDEGKEKWSFATDAGSLTTPALGDIDQDGEVEIVFGSKDKHLYCLSAGGALNPGRLPWPMINRDPQLSGNAAAKGYVPAPAIAAQAEEPALSIEGFDPLRTGINAISVALRNHAAAPRCLEAAVTLTRPDGSTASNTVARRLEAGETKSSRFDVETLLPGKYTLTAQLLDLGTGEQLEKMKQTAAFVPLEGERAEMEANHQEISALAARLSNQDARQRQKNTSDALDAENTARQDALSGKARALFDGKKAGMTAADLADVRNAAECAEAVLATQRHMLARLRAAATQSFTDFAVLADTTLKKVFRDEPYLLVDREENGAHISLARNEREGVQFVLVPLWRELKNLRVTVSDLKNADGSTIKSSNIEVHPVGYIEIGPPEYNWPVEKVGFYPDVLLPNAPIDVPSDRDAQPFFVTAYAPGDAPAGDYEGTVRFEADGCAAVDAPLSVHVWDFALPEQMNLKTSCWMNEGQIQRFYKFEGRLPFDVRKRFYDLHLKHRVCPVKDFPLDGGNMLEDFEYLIAQGQNVFFIGVPEYLEPDQRAAYAEKLRSTRDLLVKEGWNDMALFYTRDEVAVMARHIIPKVVEMNHWIHEVIPEWPRLQTSAPEQSLFGAVDVWCPTIDHFEPVVLEDRMAKGDRLWFYTVWGRPGIMIEFPPTDYRLMMWQCWKYGAEGFLYWGTTHWDLNMAKEQRWPEIPWISYNRQPGHNGCGYLIYPGPDATPLASVRLELLRDGIEDYEYLHLLRSLLAGNSGKLSAGLRQRAEAALEVPETVLVEHEHFTEDPAAILDARAKVAAVIEEVAKSIK